MNLIERDELKTRLDRGDDFKLVMALGELAYLAKHIPGTTLHTSTPGALLEMLDAEDDIVIYCTNPNCVASIAVYRFLENNGYHHIKRYAGGLEDWETSGNLLEGNLVESTG